MSGPTIRFTEGEQKKQIRKANVYQDKVYDIAYLLHARTADMPTSLAANSAIFNNDTGEFFFGNGIDQPLKPINYKFLEDKIKKLEKSVYTKTEIDQFFDNDIDLNGIIDRLNMYTVQKIDELLANKGAEIEQLKTDTEAQLALCATKDELNALKDNVYTKAEVDQIVNQAITNVLTNITAAFS